MDYQEGDSLLGEITWYQDPPYNQQCPWYGCGWGIPDSSEHYNENAYVGCVATAGAMVLHYWNWPPYGAGTIPYSDEPAIPSPEKVVPGLAPGITISPRHH